MHYSCHLCLIHIHSLSWRPQQNLLNRKSIMYFSASIISPLLYLNIHLSHLLQRPWNICDMRIWWLWIYRSWSQGCGVGTKIFDSVSTALAGLLGFVYLQVHTQLQIRRPTLKSWSINRAPDAYIFWRSFSTDCYFANTLQERLWYNHHLWQLRIISNAMA